MFIYGAKEAGVNIAKALRVNLRNHYRLRGFIADEPELINKVMMGVRVFPNDDTLIDVLNDRDVQTIIISPAKKMVEDSDTFAPAGLPRFLEEAERLLSALPGLEVEQCGNWNKRYRDNLVRMKSGDLYEVARVIKC